MMMIRSTSATSLLCVALAAGCTGEVLDVGAPQVADGGAGAPETGDAGGEPTTEISVTVPQDAAADGGDGDAGASGVEAARETCEGDSHGPVATYETPAELTALIAHKWMRCATGDAAKSLWRDGEGIELTADGKWYALSIGDGGAVTRMSGIDHEGTFKLFGGGGFHELTDTTKVQISYVYLYSSTGSFVPTETAFEQAPARMRTVEASSATTTWFAPLVD